jgi:hypothetical protein
MCGYKYKVLGVIPSKTGAMLFCAGINIGSFVNIIATVLQEERNIILWTKEPVYKCNAN